MKKDKERIGPPIAEDWDNAKSFVYFLKIFYDATLELSASKTLISQLIYPCMMSIQIKIEKKCSDDLDPALKKAANAMKKKYQKHWGDWNKMNHLIFIANVLDSRNKLQMIKVSIKKLGGTAQRVQELIGRVKDDLITLWTEYKGVNDSSSSERNKMSLECNVEVETNRRGVFLDELTCDMDAQIEEDQLQQICNEVDKYLVDEIEKRSNLSFDLLDWWKGSETRYPILSHIANDIFAIPNSTVASESAFSLGRRGVDHFRSSLSAKMVEALVCTNDWLKAEDFSLYKDPTDDDLELYKEIEEIEKSKIVRVSLF